MGFKMKPKPILKVIGDMLRNSMRVVVIIWKSRPRLVFALLITLILSSIAPSMISGSRGFLINEIVDYPSKQLIIAILAFIGVMLFAPLVRIITGYIEKIFDFFLSEKFETMIVAKSKDIDVASLENPAHNDLFQRVRESGYWRIQNFASRQFFIFQNILEAVIAAAILIFADWQIALIIIISAVPELIVEGRYGHWVWGIWSGRAEIRRRYWNIRRHFENIPSLTEIRISSSAQYFLEIIKELFQSFQNEEKKAARRHLTAKLISFVVSNGIAIFAFMWFILLAVKGEILIGTFTFFLSSIGNFRQALSGLFLNLGHQYQDNFFVTDVFKFLDLKPAITSPKQSIKLPGDTTPEIVFKNVTFRYPNTEHDALKNFSLTISPGEKLALVGANGAGKTTFVKLLARFYDPQEGEILINGHNIKNIDLESWYYQIGALFQDYSNYHLLVKDAIAIGRVGSETAIEKVKAAAEASEADVFIEEWEKQYEQHLGKQFEGGVEPSVGQWQKLALARTFYRDPRILILDEPTSAIDAEAEAKIFEKLEKLPKDRTVILISHRFSTVRQANRIGVIEDGRLSELDTHEELLKKNGTYARLFKLQAKGYQ